MTRIGPVNGLPRSGTPDQPAALDVGSGGR